MPLQAKKNIFLSGDRLSPSADASPSVPHFSPRTSLLDPPLWPQILIRFTPMCITTEWPQHTAYLNRSAGGKMLSDWMWSSRLLLGQPAGRFQLLLSVSFFTQLHLTQICQGRLRHDALKVIFCGTTGLVQM